MKYSYREAVEKDVRGWMTDHCEEIEGLDRHGIFEVVYDGCWIADEVTGNASGSYTFSRYEARRNFFEDEESDEYISQMMEDGFLTTEELGDAIAESNWEKIDVCIRCWLLTDVITEIIDD